MWLLETINVVFVNNVTQPKKRERNEEEKKRKEKKTNSDQSNLSVFRHR